jgi:hypothetical protein
MKNILQLALNSPNIMRSARLIARYVTTLPTDLFSFVQSFLAYPYPSDDVCMQLNLKHVFKSNTVIYINNVPFSSQLFIAPGSSQNHHLYPGGLLAHTALNLQALTAINRINRRVLTATEQQGLIAAHIVHDLFKACLLNWELDGTPTQEERLEGTGIHHILALIETVKRDGPLFLTQLIAHIHSSDDSKAKEWLNKALQLAGKSEAAISLSGITSQSQVLGTFARLAEVLEWEAAIFCEACVRQRLRELAEEAAMGRDWPQPNSPEERWVQNIILMTYGEFKLYEVSRDDTGQLISYCYHIKHKLQQLKFWPLAKLFNST